MSIMTTGNWQLATGNWRRRPNGKTKTAHQHQIVRWVREFLHFAKDPSARFACSGTMPGRKRKQYQYPLTKNGQSRIGGDFQKFCWSKWKIFRACSFLVTLRNGKRYAIDIFAGQKIFLGGWSKSRVLRQYVCIRKKRTVFFFTRRGNWQMATGDGENLTAKTLQRVSGGFGLMRGLGFGRLEATKPQGEDACRRQLPVASCHLPHRYQRVPRTRC
jgi:hypothetical protein